MPLRTSKVFIVDDHPRMRESLRKLVEFEADLCVCGEAGNVEDGFNGIMESTPDAAIVDLEIGKESGLDLIARLAQALRKIPVLILSMHPESIYAEKCIQQGAAGYLMKGESPEQILLGLRQVVSGQIYLSPAMQHQRKHRPA
jgi:DNA-binding NarL/FixJ family response regulator